MSQDRIHAALAHALAGCQSVLDVGCGPGTYLNPLPMERKLGLDAFPGELHEVEAPTICADASVYLPALRADAYDAVIALDVVEHLEKEAGLALVAEMVRVAARVVVVFTPDGLHVQDEDPTEMGNDFQIHRSAWTPGDLLGLGFIVQLWWDFDYGKGVGNGRGGLWAVAKKAGS